MKPNIALVTAAAARDQDEDLAPLVDALHAQDINVHVVDWDAASADWSVFDLALLRSTWDYTMRFPEFIGWVQRAGKQTLLLNPLPVIGWRGMFLIGALPIVTLRLAAGLMKLARSRRAPGWKCPRPNPPR